MRYMRGRHDASILRNVMKGASLLDDTVQFIFENGSETYLWSNTDQKAMDTD